MIRQNASTCTEPLYLALAAAEAGRAVFPLRDKQPLTAHGFKDASRDRSRIVGAFNAARNATGYGIATGQRSGVVVVDIDGPEARAEAERRGLASGYVVRTGRKEGDGWHVYFTAPPGGIKGRTLAPGIELKADGQYVAGPGSLHPSGRRYRIARGGEPSPLPGWIMGGAQADAPKRPKRAAGPVLIDVAGPPIAQGERNRTLASIAGRLHDGTRDLDALTRDLAAVNAARCQPPLHADEVAKIAASIYRREPCNPGGPRADAATLAALAEIEAVVLWGRDWRGAGGKSERDAVAAFIVEARRRGKRIAAGVRMEWSYAEWAVAAGVSKRSLFDSRRDGKPRCGVISRLKRAGILRSDSAGRRRTDRGAFVLDMPSEKDRAKVHHYPIFCELDRTEFSSGETLRAPRLRRSVRYIRRLGKTRGAAIDYLELVEGAALREDLAEFLSVRKRDLNRRVLMELESAGIVRFVGEIVALTDDYRDAIERRRLRDGEVAAEVRDTERRRRHGEEHRRTAAQPSDIRREVRLAPSDAERYACQELREIADANRERRRARDRRHRMRDAVKANPVAAMLREFLGRNPHRTGETASWLAVALWADLGIPKPNAGAVAVALAELRDGVAA